MVDTIEVENGILANFQVWIIYRSIIEVSGKITIRNLENIQGKDFIIKVADIFRDIRILQPLGMVRVRNSEVNLEIKQGWMVNIFRVEVKLIYQVYYISNHI